MSYFEYLSPPTERLAWKGCALPVDDLCTENAIIMSRFNRYPLIIDPSGQVLLPLSDMGPSRVRQPPPPPRGLWLLLVRVSLSVV